MSVYLAGDRPLWIRRLTHTHTQHHIQFYVDALGGGVVFRLQLTVDMCDLRVVYVCSDVRQTGVHAGQFVRILFARRTVPVRLDILAALMFHYPLC